MQNYRKYIFVLIIISAITAQNIDNTDSLYQVGNNAMLSENFNSAIQYYENIIEQGYEHKDLYYNLGNAYYRTNKIGNAIWSYEKGLQLSPRDKDIKFNLSLANTRVRDRIEMPPTILFLEQYRAVKKSITLMDIVLIAAVIFMLGAFVYFIKKYYGWRSVWVSRLIITLFLISILVHLMALDKYLEISDKKEVIIVQQEVNIYSAPFDRKESVLFRLHEGVKAEVTQDKQNWLEIELIDGKKGWIQTTKVCKL